jgi:hypothetical protein
MTQRRERPSSTMINAEWSDEAQSLRNQLCSFCGGITGAQRNMTSINDPKHWRDRAAEMRALAKMMKDAETIEIMNRLAEDYEKLADRAAQRQARPSGNDPERQ